MRNTLCIITIIITYLINPCVIHAQNSTTELLSYKDHTSWMIYTKGDESIRKEDIIPILESKPESNKFLRKAQNSDIARVISFLSFGIGVGIIAASNSLDDLGLGVGFAGGGLAVGVVSHFGYQSYMKQAIAAYNEEHQKLSYIEIFQTGIDYRF